MKNLFTKKLTALLAVMAIAFSSLGNFGFSVSAEEAEAPVGEVVMQTISEDRAGFSMTVAGAANGAGAQITQDPVAFNYNYLALKLVSTYVVNAGGDKYFPIQLFLNGNHVAADAVLPTYNADGTPATEAVEIKWGGWMFITPDFDGYIYLHKDLINITELSSLKIAFDGYHDGELVLTEAFGCGNAGERLGAPVVNENNLVAQGDGVTVSDGFVVDFVSKGSAGTVTANHDAIAFESNYLAVDLTINSASNVNGPGDDWAVFELRVNGTLILGETAFQTYERSNIGFASAECKWPNWFFVPAGFDGIIYIPAEKIGNPSAISSFAITFDAMHHANVKVNAMFGCDKVGSDFVPHTGTQYTTTDDTVIMNATTVENTYSDGSLRSATATTSNTVAMTDSDYLAVYIKMESKNNFVGGPEVDPGDYCTFIRFSANGILLPELGGVTAYPTTGESYEIEHKWGNWLLIHYNYEGMFYFPVSSYLAGQTELRSFTFGFNETLMQKIEYKVGVAHEIGGEVTYLDFAAGGEAEIVKPITKPSKFVAASEDVVSVMDLTSFANDEGIITDEAVTLNEGIVAFNTYSYSYVKFGGIYVAEDWENQLVINVKTAFEGGVAISPDDADEDYGFMEIDVEDFDMGTGLAINVLSLVPENYFRVLVIDENGVAWTADHGRYDYTCVSDRVPVGMPTMYNNFYCGEDYYGTLYIQKEWFAPAYFYNGELNATAEEMGKITKVVIGMDHLWGLGRALTVGKIVNVDIENNAFELVCNPAEMTDEELGVGLSGGTKVSCPGSETHVNNFSIRRLLLEETPGYEPEEGDDPIGGDSSSIGGESSSVQQGTTEKPMKSCKSALGGSLLSVAVVAMAAFVLKRKNNK